ncbi:hypothetical protein M3P21_07985 [Ruegeria sp. 2012CJ41-6]|uniref:Glycerophosphoryl diester phosphodiesterase membrane domain-containing protein n=1 Tax=Ruegeria spongiae TaxID=2942209 RepID=A0ABT0Q111_9RHOB|nr:hypothetical protein [Ruegeria spongiae]MCL6283473.1 hypothetical protein [Ruegeria spongiae]
MLGWKIFVHSVGMVLRNLKEALQISVIPGFLGFAVIIGLFFVFGIPFENFDTETTGLPAGVTGGEMTLFFVFFMVTIFVVMFWIVVSWHRFVLLEEYPSGIIPPFRFDRILAYFGRYLLLMLLALLAFIPAGLVMLVLREASGLVTVVAVAAFLVLVVCFIRLSIILPAAAIGKPITLSQAWAATTGSAGAIIVLIIVSVLFQIAIQFGAALLAMIPVLGIIIVLFATMLVLPLINVSILTTMYGHFVEKRDLT